MKRTLASMLWFLVGWTFGGAVAMALGVSPALGPILAIATAGIVIADPRQVIWTGGMRPGPQLSAPTSN